MFIVSLWSRLCKPFRIFFSEPPPPPIWTEFNTWIQVCSIKWLCPNLLILEYYKNNLNTFKTVSWGFVVRGFDRGGPLNWDFINRNGTIKIPPRSNVDRAEQTPNTNAKQYTQLINQSTYRTAKQFSTKLGTYLSNFV